MMATVISTKQLCCDMTAIEIAGGFDAPEPGTFAHIKAPNAPQLILRRPISVMGADSRRGTALLGIRPAGEGTRLICAANPGDSLDVLLPLGHGFSLSGAKRLWLVGGGVGVAPLCLCAARYAGSADITAFLGFRSAAHAYGTDIFTQNDVGVRVCTDDGSLGAHGLVTDAFYGEQQPDLVMACGPLPMLRAVKAFCRENGIRCQLSLEERMGCGFGACLTCSCAAADGQSYRRVCADGPVFWADEVSI